MPLETPTYISDLNALWPLGTDSKSDGDNHLRNFKGAVKTTFPNVTGAVTKTHTQLNNALDKTGDTMSGNLGIGITPAYALDVTGNHRVTGNVAIKTTPATNVGLRIGQAADQTLGTDYAISFAGVGYVGGIALNATSMQIGQNSPTRSLTFHAGTSFAERLRINGTTGDVTVTGSGGLGYGTGSGGTVTQATSKATAVTLNKPAGKITTNNALLAAAASATFQVNNSFAAASDGVVVTVASVTTNYRIEVAYITTGIFFLRLTNVGASGLSEAVDVNFQIIKGATA